MPPHLTRHAADSLRSPLMLRLDNRGPSGVANSYCAWRHLMKHAAFAGRLLALALLALLVPFAASANGPAVPEPKVVASIGPHPDSPTSCMATVEVGLPPLCQRA
jgi:hypothetical protein